jgi:hypothetical protein
MVLPSSDCLITGRSVKVGLIPSSGTGASSPTFDTNDRHVQNCLYIHLLAYSILSLRLSILNVRSSFRSRIMITSRKCVLCDWSNFDFVVKWDSNVAKWDLFTSPSRFAYLFYIKYIFMYSLYVHIVEDYSHQGKIAEEAPKCTRQVARMSAQWCSSEKLKYAKHFTVRDRESRIDLA